MFSLSIPIRFAEMGVAVLHPQSHLVADPLFPIKRGLLRPPAKAPAKAKPNANRAHQNRRRKSSAKSPATPAPPAPPAKSLVVGHVRILKRGEVVASPATAPESKVETGAERTEEVAASVSPAPETAQSRAQKAEPAARVSAGPDRVLAGFYAGSAFITSPPPSSVPMPAFFNKKTDGLVGFVDPTSDLRRLLRLD